MENNRPSNKLMYAIVGIIMVITGLYVIFRQVSAIEYVINTPEEFRNGIFVGTIVIYIVLGVLEIITGVIALALCNKLDKQNICTILAIAIIALMFINALLTNYYTNMNTGIGGLAFDQFGRIISGFLRFIFTAIAESCVPALLLFASLQNKMYWRKHLRPAKQPHVPAAGYGQNAWQASGQQPIHNQNHSQGNFNANANNSNVKAQGQGEIHDKNPAQNNASENKDNK